MTKYKIFADFNNTDVQGRVRLNVKGAIADIEKYNIELKKGLEVMLDDDDGLKAKGILEFSEEERMWVVRIQTFNY